MTTVIKLHYTDSHVKADLDDGESFLLPFDIVSAHRLETGKKIEGLQYRQLREESERFTCGRKALSYLAVRSRSSKEMETYLKRKGFSSEIIREVTSKLHDSGYLSDYDFALRYARDRLNRKMMGKNFLKKELYAKGISREIINKVLRELGADDMDFQGILAQARKKYRSLKNKNRPSARLAAFLQQRGFDWELINRVVAVLEKEEGVEGE
jgi:regulatory protein